MRFGDSAFGASARREKGENRVVELLLALRDSQTVSLRVPSGHHVEVGARRPPELSNPPRSKLAHPGTRKLSKEPDKASCLKV